MSCRLCLTENHDLLEIFGDEGRALKIADIITKHFWFEVLQNDTSNSLCKDCWINTSNFHIFYCEIEKKQSCFIFMESKVSAQEENSTVPLLHDNKDDYKPEVLTEFKSEVQNLCTQREYDNNDHAYVDLEEKFEDEIKDEQEQQPQIDDSEQVIRVTRSKRKIVNVKPIIIKEKKPKRIKKEKPTKVVSTNPKFREFEEKWRKSYKDGNALEGSIKEYCKMECFKCTNVSFTKWLEMKKHYRDEHQMAGYIVCCNKKFSKRVRILEHIARHLNPEAFRCELCNKNYADRASLDNHMYSHNPVELRPYKCDKCEKSFAKNYQLAAHQIRHIPEAEKRFVCPECGKCFASQSILNTHIRGVHEGAYMHVCEVCAKVFKSKMFFEKHKMDVHMNIQEPKKQCQLCGSWLKHERSLRSHMERHEAEKNTYACKICGKVAPNKEALQSHNRYVHLTERTHKCSVCEKAFKKAINLKEHMTLHTGETLYNCQYCSKTFNSSANMHAHKKKIHKLQWEENQKLKTMSESVKYE